MQTQRFVRRRLWVEELEPRVVPSASPGLHGIVPTPVQSVATTSTNWAGYAVQTNLDSPQANAVTAVSGSWNVPSVAGKGTAFSSIWVGVDGYTSSTVQQIGTSSDIVDGQPQYYAWYEMFPNDSFSVANLTIRAGDSISASVTYIGSDQFSLQLTNNTTNESFSITQTAYGAQRSSAEWIVEAPSSSNGVLPLAKFGTANITGASATIGGETGPIDNPAWQNASIDMVSSRGVTKATTSVLDDTATVPPTSSLSVSRVSPNTPTAAALKGPTKTTKGPQDTGMQEDPTVFATFVPVVPQVDLNRNIPPALIGNGSNAASAPVFINVQAFQQNGLAPTFFLGGSNGNTLNFRLSSIAGTNLDLPEIPMPPVPDVPAPAVQPLPNGEIRPALQEPMPMQQDMPSRDEIPSAILGVEDFPSDARAESRAACSGGLAKTFVSLLGAVGAFTLFNGGGFMAGSRSADEREEFERDRLHAN
jgi:hypothetical protein